MIKNKTMLSVSLETNERVGGSLVVRKSSLSSGGFWRRGMTKECLKSRVKPTVDKERLANLEMMGTRTDAQSFRKYM